MVQPDDVADDFRGKTKTAIAGFWLFHRRSLPDPGQLDNTLSDVGYDDGGIGGYSRGQAPLSRRRKSCLVQVRGI